MQYNNDPDLIAQIRDLQQRLDKLERQNPLQRATIDIANNSVAQDTGLKVIDSSTGLLQFELGGTSNPRRPDGTLQPYVRIRRDDGTIALELIDRDPLDATGYKQALSVYDRAGNKIFGDDYGNFGLAAPFIHYGLQALNQGYSSTFTFFQDALFGGFTVCSPKLYVSLSAVIAAGTPTGEAQVLIDGVVYGPPQQWTTTTTIAWSIPLTSFAMGSQHTITVQMRVAAGSGGSNSVLVRPYVIRSDST